MVELMRGMEVKKKEALGKFIITWKQGSILGVGGDRSQMYNLFAYETPQGGKVPVYIQDGYDIPNKMVCHGRLQCGMNDGVFFLVYHDQEQKPFQHRFSQHVAEKELYQANDWLKSTGVDGLSRIAGDYLRDF